MERRAHGRNGTRAHGAFTLVEVAVVLIIMGILAAVLIPTVFTGSETEHRAAAREEVLGLKEQITGYFLSPPEADKAAPTDLVFLPGAGFLAGRVDFWGRAFRYRTAPELVSNAQTRYLFCKTKATSLSVRNGKGLVRNVAFVVGSPGPDRNEDIDYAPSPVDLTSAPDDIAEYVTLFELVGMACRGY